MDTLVVLYLGINNIMHLLVFESFLSPHSFACMISFSVSPLNEAFPAPYVSHCHCLPTRCILYRLTVRPTFAILLIVIFCMWD